MAPPNGRYRNFLVLRILRSLVDSWEVNSQSRAFLRLLLHATQAAALLNDAVNGGKPQSSSLALLLGGEERLENARFRFGIHAMTSVRNREQNILAGHNRMSSQGAFPSHCHVTRFDG